MAASLATYPSKISARHLIWAKGLIWASFRSRVSPVTYADYRAASFAPRREVAFAGPGPRPKRRRRQPRRASHVNASGTRSDFCLFHLFGLRQLLLTANRSLLISASLPLIDSLRLTPPGRKRPCPSRRSRRIAHASALDRKPSPADPARTPMPGEGIRWHISPQG